MITPIRPDVRSRVNQVVFATLHPRVALEDLSEDRRLVEDLRAESIDLVQIFYGLMAEFDLDLDRNSISQLRSMADLYHHIGALTERASPRER